jgi:hypothetical protein
MLAVVLLERDARLSRYGGRVRAGLARLGGTVEPRVLGHDAKGEGEPIVLVPGGLTGWLSWVPHQERLSVRYHTIRGT